ncbi:MAG: DNA topoisomerase 3 [Acidaminococcaceae bacterium]|nr:DNA topoisomerase 3 [Acidaminococcaceae bacterium]
MQTLYIAEKPDIANAIAGYLWPSGGYKKGTGFYQKDDTVVSWAVGHLLELATPEAYDKRYANWKNYRIFPAVWKHEVIARSAAQFKVVEKLLKTADVVVHAGDPDREGQLLIEEILHYCNYQGRVQRLLINAKDDISIKRAFASIEDNAKFENLYAAGLVRQQADWLVGINLTRCYTTYASKFSPGAVWNIGRVKVPTLALVVDREKEILNFKVRKYYELKAAFTKEGIHFTALWQPDEEKIVEMAQLVMSGHEEAANDANNLVFDEEGRLLDKRIAEAVREKVLPADGIVQKVTRKKGTEAPPLPYSLDTLQVEANARFGISPKLALSTVQSLYEKKYVSYPRSDCNYIPWAQHKDAYRILQKLASRNVRGAEQADPAMRSRAWNDKKVTAHHAIIPTGEIPRQLSATEEKIFTMIAERYVMQFYPPCEFETITFEILLADELFKGSGKVILKPGFKAVFGSKKNETENQEEENLSLPDLSKGENLGKPEAVDLLEKETKPPKRFTEGTLLAAMANIYRFMDPKNPNREKLKEVKGIGTPATRDTIISELQGIRNNKKTQMPFMEKVKKELVPTELGFQLIDNVDVTLTKPDTTAEMEFALTEISEGEGDLGKFTQEIYDTIDRNIAYAEAHQFPGYKMVKCPVCKTGNLVKHYSRKTKKAFYVCDNQACVSPVTGKPVYYDVDKNGQPVLKQKEETPAQTFVCPVCGKETLNRHYSAKTKQYFCVCDDKKCVSPVTKKTLYYAVDKEGNPVIERCSKDQAILEKKKSRYGFFWSCPQCRTIYKDSKGRPKL